MLVRRALVVVLAVAALVVALAAVMVVVHTVEQLPRDHGKELYPDGDTDPPGQ